MLHLEYNGNLGNFAVDIPIKIICLDKRFPIFYQKVLELEVEYIFDEPVAKISNWINYEWFWISELTNLQYIDYERVKDLKAFL